MSSSTRAPSFTHHARCRADARGISLEAVDAAVAWGRGYRSRGLEVIRLDRRSVERAQAHGANVRAYEGVHVVLAEDGRVVTAYRNRRPPKVRR